MKHGWVVCELYALSLVNIEEVLRLVYTMKYSTCIVYFSSHLLSQPLRPFQAGIMMHMKL